MKIAFYYHSTVVFESGKVKAPGYIGLFIESLAFSCEELYYMVHQAPESEVKEADYEIKAENIKFIDLGVKTPAWHREIFHKKILEERMKDIECCDVLIVRSPTPLASYFKHYVRRPKIWYMIVGDYLKAIDHYKDMGLRGKLIYYYLHVNDFIFHKAIKDSPILTNSPALYERYSKTNSKVFQIKTTTLKEADFYHRTDTCDKSIINILYTGSYNPAKGVFELIEAIGLLKEYEKVIHLHFVGWENAPEKPVENAMMAKAQVLGIEDMITIHGKKKIGEELNTMYRMADIYVMPTHHEGFPRTIWEAMANGLPVVASAVGGIPKFLTDEVHGLLIPPKDINEISNALRKLIEDGSLRQFLIANAYELVKDVTLEVQTNRLVEIMKNNQH